MLFFINYRIGQKIKINGTEHTITGIDVYICKDGKPGYIRVFTDKSKGKYIILKKKNRGDKQ